MGPERLVSSGTVVPLSITKEAPIPSRWTTISLLVLQAPSGVVGGKDWGASMEGGRPGRGWLHWSEKAMEVVRSDQIEDKVESGAVRIC